MLQVVVAMVEDALVVISTLKAKAIMKGTSLESPMLPIIMGFSVLMEFGWLFGGAPNAHTTGFHDVALLAGSRIQLPPP